MSVAKSQRPSNDCGPDLEVDEVFTVLSNRRRRFVLHYLLQQGEPVELPELANQVTAWEYRISLEEVTYEQRKRVYTALRQTHLPSMDDAGVIYYDTRAGSIEPTISGEEFDIYMDIVPGDEIPWSQYYLGLGCLFCTITLSAAIVPFPPFTTLPDLAWAGFFALLLAVSAAIHTYRGLKGRLGSSGEPPELRIG